MPSYLSQEVRSLLSIMLVVDPSNRATISEIKQHPWFSRNLAEYLIDKRKLNEAFDVNIIEKISNVFVIDIEPHVQYKNYTPRSGRGRK